MRIWDKIRRWPCRARRWPLLAARRLPRRPRRRTPGRRCGRSPTPTRPSICSARSICCRRARDWRTPAFDKAAQRGRDAGRRDHHRRQEPAGLRRGAGPAQLSPRPAADRRARPPGQARRPATRRSPRSGIPDGRAQQYGNLGGRLQPAAAAVQGARRVRRRRRRADASRKTFAAAGKPIEQLETNAPAARLLRRACPKPPSASCSKARSKRRPTAQGAVRRHARRLDRAATSRRSAAPSTPICRPRPSSRTR